MTEPQRPRRAPELGLIEAGRRLRLARLAQGLTQSQLAEACGITRQAVAGAEAGSWSPSLSVALAVARALGTTVDLLFAPEARVQAVPALPLAPSEPGRARLARVFDRWVALPLRGDRAATMGFAPASGRLLPAGEEPELWGSGRALVVAGCDPALPLLAAPLLVAGEGWGLDWWSCGSGEAARLLTEGRVHAALVHYRTAVRKERLAEEGIASVGFARWREGLVLRPGSAPGPDSVEEAVRLELRWVNREPGAQARSLLDASLREAGIAPSEVPGYGAEVSGHMLVASAVSSGLAQVGVANEPAALAYGLRFAPLSEEEAVIQVERRRLESPEIRALLLVLGGPQLRRELAAIPGYDVAITGEAL